MPYVRYTHKSLRDMDAIGEYIAKENAQAARRLLRSIKDKCKVFAETPLIGSQRDEFGEGTRVFSLGSYLVFYHPADSGITVLRVLHGARDLPEVFRSEE